MTTFDEKLYRDPRQEPRLGDRFLSVDWEVTVTAMAWRPLNDTASIETTFRDLREKLHYETYHMRIEEFRKYFKAAGWQVTFIAGWTPGDIE